MPGHENLYPPDLPFGRSVSTRFSCTKVGADRGGSRQARERGRTEGGRDDEHGGLGAATRGYAARGGAEPVKEGAASGSQGTHRLQMGLDRGLGGDEGCRPPPQVLPDAEESRLGP